MTQTHLYGLDFTSAPRPGKPITCASAVLEGNILHTEHVEPLLDFAAFESLLARPGPWVAGIDAPFSQPRRLVEALGWPRTWAGYVEEVAQLSKQGFEQTLKGHMETRPKGDKLHRRQADDLAGAVSPMALSYVPVGKMFFELAPRLLRTNLNVAPLRGTSDSRTVLEVYPALVARQLIGKKKYKSDTKQKQTEGMRAARQEIIGKLRTGLEGYALRLELGDVLCAYLIDDATGDALDAVLCAVQAAWAVGQENYGIPNEADRLEGWIADPTLTEPLVVKTQRPKRDTRRKAA